MVLGRTAAAARALCAAAVLIGFLAVTPAILVMLRRPRLPRTWPSMAEMQQWQQNPDYPGLLTNVAAGLVWMVWALVVYIVAARAVHAATRIRLPMPKLAVPLHTAVGGLFGASVIAATPAAAATHTATAAVAPTSSAPAEHSLARAVAAPGLPATTESVMAASTQAQTAERTTGTRPVTFLLDGDRYTVIVAKHDTMSAIAKAWYGNESRWPDICRANWHRHFDTVGGTLHDCDLIYPNWDLRLPAGATPPPGAIQLNPPPTPVTPPAAPPAPATPPATASTTAPPSDPDGLVAPLAPTAAASPSNSAPAPTRMPADDTSTGTNHWQIRLPDGSWLTAAAAAALLAAAAGICVARRRAYQPSLSRPATIEIDPDAAEPGLLRRLRIATRRNPGPSTDHHVQSPSPSPAGTVDVQTAMAAGMTLTGDGAHAAARAAIVERLARDAASTPNVFTTAETVRRLFTDRTIAAPSGMKVAVGVDETLRVLHTEVLARSRLLDEHDLTDVAQLPDSINVQPLLLVLSEPETSHRDEIAAILHAGQHTAITALLLAETGPCPVWTVSSDGAAACHNSRLATKLPVLDIPGAADALAMLSGATETKHATVSGTAGDTADHAAGDKDTRPAPPPALTTPPTAGTAPVRILGTVHIGGDSTGRPSLRAKSQELLIYLAMHPDGVSTDTLAEELFGESRLHQATASVHQCASNLRKGLAHASGAAGDHVPRTHGRYRLNRDLVTIDWWQLVALHAKAATADPPQRHCLLRQAAALCEGGLAQGLDPEWITGYRETVRRRILDIHTALADSHTDRGELDDVFTMVNAALTIDPYDEHLYRRLMQAHHASGEPAAVAAAWQRCTAALAELDLTPTQDTAQLAIQLGLKQANETAKNAVRSRP